MAEPDVWGDDPKLVELLGAQGEAGFRALFDGFPESVGVLWARRDDAGKVVDFTFGYGNPSILRAFRLPPSMRDRYTLLFSTRQHTGPVGQPLAEPDPLQQLSRSHAGISRGNARDAHRHLDILLRAELW